MIESYSLWGAKQIIASDNLFPSNYKKRKLWERDSISDTIEQSHLPKNRDIFAREKDEVIAQWSGKTVRFLKRFICTWAIGLILAPAGVVYHGHSVAKFTILCLPKVGSGNCGDHWKKIKQHSVAFLTDLIFGIFTYTCLTLGGAGVHLAIYNTAKLLATEGWWLSYPVGMVMWNAGQIMFAANPESSLVFLSPSRLEMVLNMKSAFLKNNCGIVNERGKLLTLRNGEKDYEVANKHPERSWDDRHPKNSWADGQGQFYDLWRQKAKDVYDKIKKINGRLGNLAMDLTDFCITPEVFRKNKRKFSAVLSAQSNYDLQKEIKEMQKAYEEFEELHGFLVRIHNP